MELILMGFSIILLLINMFLIIKAKQQNNLQNIDAHLEKSFAKLESSMKDEFSRNREEMGKNNKEIRLELNTYFKSFEDSLLKRMAEISTLQKNQLETFANQLNQLTNTIESKLKALQDQFNSNAKENRDELGKSLKSFEEQFKTNVKDFNDLQKQKFNELNNKQSELLLNTEQKLEKMRETLEIKMKSLQDDNTKQLEKMRETVDEKLHKTLENRLGESFKLVSERLEQVSKGLGEMQSLASGLATGVGNLNKVLNNVKTKGVLGEYQLESILEQILTPEQYAKNVKTKEGSNTFVEFAIKLPGKDEQDKVVWLPIDAKFPTEDYQQLIDANEQSNIALIEETKKQLANRIKACAKDIRDKYIDPPNTTDFAIMFLPFEGLYAEVLSNIGLFEQLQRDYRVVVTGPSTISAFLNSMQMGFRTLAIEKRSSEVWQLLSAVKTEFGKFGGILDKTQKKLKEASKVIETAGVRSRAIERKLREVQELPKEDSVQLLGDEFNILNTSEDEIASSSEE